MTSGAAETTAQPRAGNRGRGRPRGSVNRKTEEMRVAVENAQRRLRMMVPDGTLLDAHALLQTVYRDNAMPIFLRVEAAKSAIKVEKPALSSAQVDATVAVRLGIAQELVAANARLNAVTGEILLDGSASGPHRVVEAEKSAYEPAFSLVTT